MTERLACCVLALFLLLAPSARLGAQSDEADRVKEAAVVLGEIMKASDSAIPTSVLSKAEGIAIFWNKVFDGALGWTSELSKFGAHVFLSDPHRVITFGGKPLAPAEVESPYIIRVARFSG